MEVGVGTQRASEVDLVVSAGFKLREHIWLDLT